MSDLRTRSAFTLIELLVVVSIIALLISILLPSLTEARKQARRIKCMTNVRQITVATLAYVHDNAEVLPRHSRHTRSTEGYFLQNHDVQVIYEDYLGGTTDGRTPNEFGQTGKDNSMRFRTHKVFICPSNVRKHKPHPTRVYNYFRHNYAMYAGSTNGWPDGRSLVIKLEDMRQVGLATRPERSGGTEVGLPALWGEPYSSRTRSTNSGTEWNHWDGDRAAGGNVSRLDGSASWFPRADPPNDLNADDAYVGTNTLLPSNSVILSVDGDKLMNHGMGNWGGTWEWLPKSFTGKK